jgi:hypothetical protein
VCGEKQRIEAKGAQLFFVGNGSPTNAAEFRQAFRIDAPVYVDPSLRSYRALGLRASGSMWKALKAVPRAMAAGFGQGLTKGDTMQLGGVFVVAPGGEVLFQYVSEAAGDHPSVDAIVESLPG